MLGRVIAALRGRQYGLRSKHIKEKQFEVQVDGKAVSLVHSALNLEWLTELGITPKTIIDLGSYDGGDAYRFKQGSPARVITVEADPNRYALVKANLAGQDIEALNFAACSNDGDIEWYPAQIDGETGAQGSIFQHTTVYREKFPMVDQADKPITVAGRRFDSLMAELGVTQVDLLHMDIEGAEHIVLATLGAIRPTLIYLEWREGMFDGESVGPETEKMLASKGYKLIWRNSVDRLYYLPQ
jgi:FkbM family methyltransferase